MADPFQSSHRPHIPPLYPALPPNVFLDDELDASEIICRGSSDEDSEEGAGEAMGKWVRKRRPAKGSNVGLMDAARTKRIHDKATNYLRGLDGIYIHSATLKGLVEANPWRKMKMKTVTAKLRSRASKYGSYSNHSNHVELPSQISLSPLPSLSQENLKCHYTSKGTSVRGRGGAVTVGDGIKIIDGYQNGSWHGMQDDHAEAQQPQRRTQPPQPPSPSPSPSPLPLPLPLPSPSPQSPLKARIRTSARVTIMRRTKKEIRTTQSSTAGSDVDKRFAVDGASSRGTSIDHQLRNKRLRRQRSDSSPLAVEVAVRWVRRRDGADNSASRPSSPSEHSDISDTIVVTPRIQAPAQAQARPSPTSSQKSIGEKKRKREQRLPIDIHRDVLKKERGGAPPQIFDSIVVKQLPEVDWKKKRPKIDFTTVSPAVHTLHRTGVKKKRKAALAETKRTKNKTDNNDFETANPKSTRTNSVESDSTGTNPDERNATTTEGSTSERIGLGISLDGLNTTEQKQEVQHMRQSSPKNQGGGLGGQVSESDAERRLSMASDLELIRAQVVESYISDMSLSGDTGTKSATFLNSDDDESPSEQTSSPAKKKAKRTPMLPPSKPSFPPPPSTNTPPTKTTTKPTTITTKLTSTRKIQLPPDTPWQGTQAQLLAAQKGFFNAFAESPIRFDSYQTPDARTVNRMTNGGKSGSSTLVTPYNNRLAPRSAATTERDYSGEDAVAWAVPQPPLIGNIVVGQAEVPEKLLKQVRLSPPPQPLFSHLEKPGAKENNTRANNGDDIVAGGGGFVLSDQDLTPFSAFATPNGSPTGSKTSDNMAEMSSCPVVSLGAFIDSPTEKRQKLYYHITSRKLVGFASLSLPPPPSTTDALNNAVATATAADTCTLPDDAMQPQQNLAPDLDSTLKDSTLPSPSTPLENSSSISQIPYSAYAHIPGQQGYDQTVTEEPEIQKEIQTSTQIDDNEDIADADIGVEEMMGIMNGGVWDIDEELRKMASSTSTSSNTLPGGGERCGRARPGAGVGRRKMKSLGARKNVLWG